MSTFKRPDSIRRHTPQGWETWYLNQLTGDYEPSHVVNQETMQELWTDFLRREKEKPVEDYDPDRVAYMIWKANQAEKKDMTEKDPNGVAAHTPGAKLDAGKPPVLQGVIDYFPLAIEAVANVSAAGAAKYTWKGWETVPDGINRYGNASVRHMLKESYEGMYDSDFEARGLKILHAAQTAWNDLARLELILRAMRDAENSKKED